MLWVICYDVVADRARLRAAKALLRYGERVQGSVYECHLSMRELKSVQREVQGIIDPTTDRVRFYPLCERDRESAWVNGRQAPPISSDTRFRVV